MFTQLTDKQCRQARLSRDSRFDGQFFVAVKTTGIFCRPICPATPPKEANVEYFFNAALATQAGFRPCLRCRPDSAPGSWAWRGNETTFQRALTLIEQGALQQQSLQALAERLGISDRYLRKLFAQQLGMNPKQYAQVYQLMFAKQLLHNSRLSVTDIAFASGFSSVRRFNDAFQKILKLTPSSVRRSHHEAAAENKVLLAFRPPLNWHHMLEFYRLRLVQGVEQINNLSYRRNVRLDRSEGWFELTPESDSTLAMRFSVSDLSELRTLIVNVRRMLDLDANTNVIENHLGKAGLPITQGLRIPGVWSTWEAGVRAILGQQVSIKAAITHLNRLVAMSAATNGDITNFPEPKALLALPLDQLALPKARRETLKSFALFMTENPDSKPEDWLSIKGIGPWTLNYARLRGLSEPDCFLSTDLVVKKAIALLPNATPSTFSPWGSYATFHCWSAQS